MNTNQLKRFAQEARIKLINQIAAKLELVLTADSAELREKTSQIKGLQEAINATSKEQVIDKVAYTWFNRFMALRFMDVNNYQPIGIQVVSPKTGYTLPELLDEAKQGHIPEELNVKRQHIYDLLDGNIPSSNAQNEAYKELLIGACNHLHTVFPFLFEKINDYTELLLPDDLTSEFSILQDIRDGMSAEDCEEVEIIGWLYQFYISEKKDEVFASKSKVKKEDIPAATQLFTPRWIVEYMVQNTVGKLWLQNRPNSKLREHMPYFIESPSVTSEDYLKVDSPEEITLLDQACGSGHILVYGFELLSKIYEEEGYNPSEIPQLIIEKNLYGFEIDERAAQLAGLALMLKARSYQRRVFRKAIEPNILCYQDLNLSEEEIKAAFKTLKVKLTDELLEDLTHLQQATNLGSLIIPQTEEEEIKNLLAEVIAQQSTTSDIFFKEQLRELKTALETLQLLVKKYHCVVDNPPYMGGGNMNKLLSDFVRKNYPNSKADLMACFMEAGLKMLKPQGFLGMINQHSWMFLSSYEKLREKLIKETFFDSLLHLGPRTFPEIGGEVVQNAAFTFWNKENKAKGSYVRLVDFENAELKRTKTLEAIQNPDCGWFYTANQNDFEKIPGSSIGSYWLSNDSIEVFELSDEFGDKYTIRQGMATGNNARFIRFWNEVAIDRECFNASSKIEAWNSDKKWFPIDKGGGFRKWYGLNHSVVSFDKFSYSILKSMGNKCPSEQLYFYNGLTWGKITSGDFSVRISNQGSIFSDAGMKIVFDKELPNLTILGFLNSKVCPVFLSCFSETLNFEKGNIAKLPIIKDNHRIINYLVQINIDISKLNWDSNELSREFNQNEILRINSQDLEETYELFQHYWQKKFYELHTNEEEINKQFIDIYGLNKELTPDVALEDITILQDELDQKKLKELSNTFKSGWQLVDGKWQLEDEASAKPDLPFDAKEVFAQFISYAVGCMFGRYSLDKEGLILANQGETLKDYLEKIILSEAEVQFIPDEDNIIPILDDEWFEDDIVGRFYEFLKASFGQENFDKNLAFVEECLGKDIRRYFVRDFYNDHIKRYKKRPIYWMFSSPKNSFNVLIYMHRYTPDTLNQILNNYLVEYREKLKIRSEHLDHIIETGTATEQTKASKEKDKLKVVLLELQEYERDTLYPLATERITIDMDDGVLVNYNKFGKAIKEVSGLNDKKTKKKVMGFDWIDVTEIR